MLTALAASSCTRVDAPKASQAGQESTLPAVVTPKVQKLASTFIPSDAIDLVSTTQMLWTQHTFDVLRRPFEFAVRADELARARSEGWTVCQEASAEWIGFYDATVTPRRFVRQKTYVLSKDGVLITLISRYYGATKGDLDAMLKESPKPIQHAAILAQDASDQDLKEAAESSQLTCDQAAPLR
jgi:hypothetical protein